MNQDPNVGDEIEMLTDGYMYSKGDHYIVNGVVGNILYYCGNLAISLHDPRPNKGKYKIVNRKT